MINDPITGCVIAQNAERSIGACIASLGFCDEIIVVDAHSTDGTCDIAAAHGARIIVREWAGYRSQRQFAANQAAHNWILSLEAHEMVSSDLASEILRIRPYGLGGHAGYQIPLLANYCSRRRVPRERNPEYRLRLFDRRRAKYRGEGANERVVAFGPVTQLRGDISRDASRDLKPRTVPKAGPLSASAEHAGAMRMFLNSLGLKLPERTSRLKE